MTTILIIDKTGVITESTIKNFVEDELYKKAGMKTNKNFSQQTEWGIELNGKKYNIRLYGKTSGQAGQENKYEFPPPIDTTLFFGKCILVNIINEKPLNLSQKEWTSIYEELYGGFEDVGSNDSDEEDEDEEDDLLPTTKEGYVKDGFIVDDSVEEDSDDSESDEEEEDVDEESEDEIKQKKSKSAAKPKPAKTVQLKALKPPTTRCSKATKIQPTEVIHNNYLDCKCELEEEPYL
jgi:hypothetical protein